MDLPDDVIIDIASKMEIKDLKRFCSQNKRIHQVCQVYSKTILSDFLKRKGFTRGIQEFLSEPKLLIAFYKIDPEFKITNLNIVKAFSLRLKFGTLLTKFLLANQMNSTQTFNQIIQPDLDLDDLEDLADQLVIDRYSKLEDKTPDQIDFLSELIRYSFVADQDFIPDEIIESLKSRSGFRGTLQDGWQDCFRKHVNQMEYKINSKDNIEFFIARKSHNYDYLLKQNEDLPFDNPNNNYVFQTLYFYCQKV